MSSLSQIAVPLSATTDAPDRRRGAHQPRYTQGANPPFLIPIALISDVVAVVTRRRAMAPADTEDFRSWTYQKLLSNDCKVLRSFSGRSSFRTYLYAVVSNLLRDFCNAHFRSRWRQTAGVARLGRWAITLDRLVNRDNVPGGEAVRTVAARADCDLSEKELRKLLAQLPMRRRPRMVPLESATDVAVSGDTDEGILRVEQTLLRRSIAEKLSKALEGIDPEDRNVIRLRFWHGVTLAEVSRRLGIPQKPLYGRLERCLERMRVALEAEGVTGLDLECFCAVDGAAAEI